MNNELFKMAIMWYLAGMLPRLRTLDFNTLKKVGEEASAISNEHPLHYCHEPQFVVPLWNSEKKLTGGQLTALMVGALWVMVGEDERMCSSLYETWPIREACLLVPR